MPLGIGPMELVIILVIVVLIFGAGKLPELGSALGRGMKEFKSAQKEITDIKESITLDPLAEPKPKPKAEQVETAGKVDKA